MSEKKPSALGRLAYWVLGHLRLSHDDWCGCRLCRTTERLGAKLYEGS